MADECAESSRRSRQCNVKSKNIFCSCAFVFTVVPCCCMIPTFVFAVVHFFCCCAIFLLFCNLNCYLFVLSFSTKKLLHSINCYPHRSNNTPLPDVTNVTNKGEQGTRKPAPHCTPPQHLIHSLLTPLSMKNSP